VSIGPSFFDSGRAFRLAEEIYPERSLGSEHAASVAEWMKLKLSAFGTTDGPDPTLQVSSFQALSATGR